MTKDAIILEKLAKYDNNSIEKLIDSSIRGYNAERNRKILKRRLIDGIKYESLSEEFDISVRQIQNVVYKCVSFLIPYI